MTTVRALSHCWRRMAVNGVSDVCSWDYLVINYSLIKASGSQTYFFFLSAAPFFEPPSLFTWVWLYMFAQIMNIKHKMKADDRWYPNKASKTNRPCIEFNLNVSFYFGILLHPKVSRPCVLYTGSEKEEMWAGQPSKVYLQEQLS